VAAEDAGDWQASSARINRMNRELEKLKAGDTVQVRVWSGGQVRTLRLASVKASELANEGFFFNFNTVVRRGDSVVRVPRAGTIKLQSPPCSGFLRWRALKLEIEKANGALKQALKQQDDAVIQFGRSSRTQIKTDAMKKVSLRSFSII
jgi:hypothetical protein